ncbi:MAG: hypothetical protein JWQ81_2204 [Amycolatopsis sp.]|uniref:endonuclease/exonuclease/phosphatase family protein n=1 Tax=Amycolatopsis sp. TaxID=37632 RepID=UPI0026207776|nr:endonuclease/exonuclease/phosphatase family protein [Amycolatopsis sp.]MCU1681465.1 hypothetical protein [Amycolatopsis sp.]
MTTTAEQRQTEAWQAGIWRRGKVLAGFAVLTALVLAGHGLVPNWVGNLGSLLETILPWVGVFVPLLLVLALFRRSALALVVLLVPTIVWIVLFGGHLADTRSPGHGDLTIVSHNVNDANPDPAGTARSLAASGAQVVALEELSGSAVRSYEDALAGSYAYHSVQGTVGIWSTYPIHDTRPVHIMPWTRALRTTVDTPKGPLTVFVAHLPSVRVRVDSGFTTDERNTALGLLADAISAGPAGRTVVVGDFNGSTDDRALAPITSRMRSAQDEAGDGFGFTWPSAFPMTRIDQIFVHGVRPLAAWTLPATGSDHLPVAASLAL